MLLVFLLSISSCLLSTEAKTFYIEKAADDIYKKLHCHIISDNMDPLKLEDIIEEITIAPLCILKATTSLSLTNGWATGLANLKRIKPVRVIENNDHYLLQFPVFIEELLIDFHYVAEFMGLGPSGHMRGRVQGLDLLISVQADMKTCDNFAVGVQSFEIVNTRDISALFSGHFLTDIFLNTVTNTMCTCIKTKVLRNWKYMFRKEIDRLLNQLILYVRANPDTLQDIKNAILADVQDVETLCL